MVAGAEVNGERERKRWQVVNGEKNRKEREKEVTRRVEEREKKCKPGKCEVNLVLPIT